MSSIQTVVSLENVGKVYEPSPPWMRFLVRSSIKKEIVALAGIDLQILQGQICAVVGPNGAGKTTMFRILTGLTTPTSGKALVLGMDAHHDSERVRRHLGWMPAEDRSLFMRLTCYENLYFHGRLQNLSRRRLLAEIPLILEQVGLAHMMHSSIFALSSGMRARLQLARALLHRPQLLILDEPTAAVDPVGAHELLSLITGIVAEHRLAALISSHRLEEIEALHANVVLLDKGTIRYQGNLDTLRRKGGRAQVSISFQTPAQAQSALEVLNATSVATLVGDRTVRTPRPENSSVGDVLMRLQPLTGAIVDISEATIPLRDLLAELYGSGRDPARSNS